MRIGTNNMFETTTARLSELQTRLLRTQEQIATGRKYLTPSEDPVGAARAFDLSQAKSVNLQYATNREAAKSALMLEEGTLQSITSLLQDVKTLTVTAGNGVLDDAQRKYLATDLSARFQELLGLANSRDANGNYLFAGFQEATTQPFTQTSTGASYAGDQGQRLLQVGPSRQLAIGDSGRAVFELNKETGNGSFVTKAVATNTGTGVASAGTVVDSTQLTGHNYSVIFTVVGAVTTYDVVDTTTGTTLSAANAYTSGQAITFQGIQFDVSGSPADNDSFTVTPNTSQNIFTTLNDLVNLLNLPGSGAANQNLTTGLAEAHKDLDNALDNILTIRASVGSRLKEIESLNAAGEDKDLQYASSLSELQDLDYAKAISSLTSQQITLTAAQQSFVKVANLSLFNFLS